MSYFDNNQKGKGCSTKFGRPDCSADFYSTLTGGQEVPPNASQGRGAGWYHLSADHQRLEYFAKVSGLTGPVTSAHFHQGLVGVSGPIVKPLQFRQLDGYWVTKGVWRANDSSFPLTPAAIDAIMTGLVYLNVHTDMYPAGEIRGQLLQCDKGDKDQHSLTFNNFGGGAAIWIIVVIIIIIIIIAIAWAFSGGYGKGSGGYGKGGGHQAASSQVKPAGPF